MQADRGAFAGGRPDEEAGIHHRGAALHAGKAIARGWGGQVKSPAIVADAKGQVFAVETDFKKGLGCERIFDQIVDRFLEDKIDVLAVVLRQPDLADIFLDVDAVLDAFGFKKGGGKVADADEEILQRIIARADTPDDIVHPFHEHHRAVFYFVHGLHGMGAAVLAQGKVAQDRDGTERGADVIMKVLGDLVSDMLHAVLQQLVGLELFDELLLAADLLLLGHPALIAKTRGKTKYFEDDTGLRKDEDVRDPKVDIPVDLKVAEREAENMTRRHKKAPGNNIIDQRAAASVDIDDKADGEQEDQGEDDGINLRLNGAVEGKEDKEEVKAGVNQQKIFHPDDPAIQARIVSRHFQEASDKAEVNIIRKDQQGLSEIDGEKGQRVKKMSTPNMDSCLLRK